MSISGMARNTSMRGERCVVPSGGPVVSSLDNKRGENGYSDVTVNVEKIMNSSSSGDSPPFYHFSPPAASTEGSLRNDADQSHSFIVEFMDQCIVNGMPESLVVEHVLLMIETMLEQINIKRASGSKQHHTRQKFVRQRLGTEGTCGLGEVVPTVRNEKGDKPVGAALCYMGGKTTNKSTAARNRVLTSRQNKSDATLIGVRRKQLASVQPTKAASTQTPQPMPVRAPTRGSRDSERMAFRGFMRPTDTSNRKETLKYIESFEACSKPLPAHHQPQSPEKSQRRKAPRSTSNRGKTIAGAAAELCNREEHLTWSDHDSPIIPSRCAAEAVLVTSPRKVQAPPSAVKKPACDIFDVNSRGWKPQVNKGTATHNAELVFREGGGVATAALIKRDGNVLRLVSSPPISIEVPLFFPNQQLQMYIERSERKMRDAMRFLDSTTEGGFNVMR